MKAGKITIDGKTDDWDLSGGIFACDNTEQMRDRYAIWFHLMYDADNLYVLAHFVDETPMNNPGQTAGDYGFAGDSVQAPCRFTTSRTNATAAFWSATNSLRMRRSRSNRTTALSESSRLIWSARTAMGCSLTFGDRR